MPRRTLKRPANPALLILLLLLMAIPIASRVMRAISPPHPAEPGRVGAAASSPPKGMVWIPPGRFRMGSPHEAFTDARPIHSVGLDGFWMDATPVTNGEFARFVQATGYVTVAERKP